MDESIHKVRGACPVSTHPSAGAASTIPFPSNSSAWTQQRAGRGCSSMGAASPRAGFGSVAAQGRCVRPCGSMSPCPLQELTLRRAREQSLRTARLPIREYMVKAPNSRNYHSETLAINQGEGLPGGWRVTHTGVWWCDPKAGCAPCSREAVPEAGDSRVERGCCWDTQRDRTFEATSAKSDSGREGCWCPVPPRAGTPGHSRGCTQVPSPLQGECLSIGDCRGAHDPHQLLSFYP